MSFDMNQQIAKIKVFGIGGAGNNAVNRMVNDGLQGVDFYVANTDLQVLNVSVAKNKLVLGNNGLGAGGNPENGKGAAQESEQAIREAVADADMVFVTAGLGGGTGTGAAPIFAKCAKESGALTVAIVTKPFSFEGRRRVEQAEKGLEELKKYVDSYIVISNDKLLEYIGKIPLKDAFNEVDKILKQSVQTITDLIAVPSFINLDFADIKSVMANQGLAVIGIGMATGENKAIEAAQNALMSPLLESHIDGATRTIINITGGDTVSNLDASDAINYIRDAAGREIDVIYGLAINEQLGDSLIVTVIATGFEEVADESNQILGFEKMHSNTGFSEFNVSNKNEPVDNVPNFFKFNK